MNGGGLKTSEGPDEQVRDNNINQTGQKQDKKWPGAGASGREASQTDRLLTTANAGRHRHVSRLGRQISPGQPKRLNHACDYDICSTACVVTIVKGAREGD